MKKINLSLLMAVLVMIGFVSCKPNGPTSIPVTGITIDTQEQFIPIGESFKIVATVSPSDASNQNVIWESSNTAVVTVDNGTVTGVAQGSATITAKTEDGAMTATCNVTVIVIDDNVKFARGVLLEDFTATWCGPCYVGMKNIQKVLANYEFGKAILVCHHVSDDFAVSESEVLADAYKVEGIPSCMLNRTSGVYGSTINFHPSSLTKEMVDKQLALDNSVDIALKTTYSEDTKELKVDVLGKLHKDFPNARLNVYLVQDSIIAKQAGGGSNYAHRNALRKVLSADGAWGETLSVTSGYFLKQYTYTIPEKIGKFASDISKMYVVAFVTDHFSTTTTDMPKNIVHNATIKKIK